jgi:membrane protein required for colicin V production
VPARSHRGAASGRASSEALGFEPARSPRNQDDLARYTVIAILVISIAWGAWRGLVHETLSLAGWIMAFVAANLLAAPLAESFPANMRPEFRVVTAFVAVFVGTLIVTTLLSALVTKFVKVSVLHGLDRWLGALFGCCATS